MMNFKKTFGVGILAAAVAFSGALPTAAAPFIQPNVDVRSDVQTVQGMDMQRTWRGQGRNWRGDRSWRGGGRGHITRRGGHHYFNGHRGFRHHRRGYREYNGFWFPLAAFAAGAVVGGAINQPDVRVRGGNAHTSWCYNRYRSYRAYDNTFQPYNGPRRQCYSPYS